MSDFVKYSHSSPVSSLSWLAGWRSRAIRGVWRPPRPEGDRRPTAAQRPRAPDGAPGVPRAGLASRRPSPARRMRAHDGRRRGRDQASSAASASSRPSSTRPPWPSRVARGRSSSRARPAWARRASSTRPSRCCRPGWPAGAQGPIVLRGDDLPAWRERAVRTVPGRAASGSSPGRARRRGGAAGHRRGPAPPAAAGRSPARLSDGRPRRRPRATGRPHPGGLPGLVGRLAADGPVVLVVEDLHVLDAASRSLVAFLARTLGERPVLLVGSYQPDALRRGHPLRATLEAIARGPRPPGAWRLAPLDRAELRRSSPAHEGEAPSAPTLLLVAERSGGSPLVAEEVLVARRELSGAALSVPLEQLVVARAARARRSAGASCGSSPSPTGRSSRRGWLRSPPPTTPGWAVRPRAPAARRARRRRAGRRDLAAGVEEAIDHGFVEVGARHPGASGTRARRPRRGQASRRASPERAVRIRHELLAGGAGTPTSCPGPGVACTRRSGRRFADRPEEAGRHWAPRTRGRAGAPERGGRRRGGRGGRRRGRRAGPPGARHRAGGRPGCGRRLSVADELDLLVRAAEASAACRRHRRADAFVETALGPPSGRPAIARRAPSSPSAWARTDWPAAIATTPSLRTSRPWSSCPPRPASTGRGSLRTSPRSACSRASTRTASGWPRMQSTVAGQVGSAARGWLGHATVHPGRRRRLARPAGAGRSRRLEDALAIAIETRPPRGCVPGAGQPRRGDLTCRGAAPRPSRCRCRASRPPRRWASRLSTEPPARQRGRCAGEPGPVGGGPPRWPSGPSTGPRRACRSSSPRWAWPSSRSRRPPATPRPRLLGRLFLEIETVPVRRAGGAGLPGGGVVRPVARRRRRRRRARSTRPGAGCGPPRSGPSARGRRRARRGARTRGREAPQRRDLAGLATARAWSDDDPARGVAHGGRSGVPADTWVRREVGADLATAAAYAARLRGHDDARGVGRRGRGRVARPRAALRDGARPVLRGRGARWTPRPRRVSGGRAVTTPGSRSWRPSPSHVDLEALPLLRQIADLAERARIALPDGALTESSRSAPPAPPRGRREGLGSRATRGRSDSGDGRHPRGAPPPRSA